MVKPTTTLLLAAPRGFCAGVDRAIQIVERALEIYGPPVYVRHEIVHNRVVVHRLEQKGAIFVDELDEVPTDAHVIFSAHGVAKSVPDEAKRRQLHYLDATCPLVSKVHREAERHHGEHRHVILIGHAGHPEVIGTMGQLPDDAITLIETQHDARKFCLPPDVDELAYITQTTLSVDETREIIQVLKERFPNIVGPRREDICYATTNRQQAVKTIAARADVFLVIGAPNSSNSLRLVEVAEGAGAKDAMLVQTADSLDWTRIGTVRTVGISAGASAPEDLVESVIAAFKSRGPVQIEEVRVADEAIEFRLPAVLRRPSDRDRKILE